VSDKKENKKQKPVEFDLHRACFRLLMKEPFFAALSRRINKIKTYGIPTAGVRLNPRTTQFEMFYNPQFLGSLTEEEVTGVLMHEYYHIVFEHVTGRKPTDESKAQLWNAAADLAINSHLVGRLPKECLMPGEGKFKKYPAGKSAEWYFASLQEDNFMEKMKQEAGKGKEGEGNGRGFGQFDDHGQWTDADGNELDDATKEIAKERLKDIMRKAANEASRKGDWGTVSASCKEEILKRIQTVVDWKKVLRYFIKTSQRGSRYNTQRRINKRYPYIHPGSRIRRQANMAISMDQSGSVGNDLLSAFYAELSKLATLATFTVIPFDHEVAEEGVYVWKRGETKRWERVRSGGTGFNPPTNWVNERNFDGHIVLTDMCAPKPGRSKCQRMWMTDEHNAANPYFQTDERVIAIKPDASVNPW